MSGPLPQSRMHSAVFDALSESKLFENAQELKLVTFKSRRVDPSPAAAQHRKSVLEATFHPMPAEIMRNDPLAAAKVQVKSDAELTLYRGTASDTTQWFDTAIIFFDPRKDTWFLAAEDDREFYWTLKKEAKLRAVQCWLEKDDLLGDIAEMVQARIAEIGQTAAQDFAKQQLLPPKTTEQ